jgi:hypothetical protein
VNIDEVSTSKEQTAFLNRYIHNPEISIDVKFGGKHTNENWIWWFLSTNEADSIRINSIGGSGQYRRFSIIKLMKQLPEVFAEEIGIDNPTQDQLNEIASAYINAELINQVYGNKEECAKFLNYCVNLAKNLESCPQALHGESYDDSEARNKGLDEEVFEEVFLHKDFSNITTQDLFYVYKKKQDEYNPSAGIAKSANLTQKARDWLKINKVNHVTWNKRVSIRNHVNEFGQKVKIQLAVFSVHEDQPVDSTSQYYFMGRHLYELEEQEEKKEMGKKSYINIVKH